MLINLDFTFFSPTLDIASNDLDITHEVLINVKNDVIFLQMYL